jgi:hypothetical protein
MYPFEENQESSPTFYEEDILALQELDPNELYVPLQRLCANLGLQLEPTIEAIKKHQILTDGLQQIRGSKSINLRVDLIPLWLSTLSTNEIQSSARAKLELYQRECASLLWQAFKPQGFVSEDALLPPRFEMTPAEQAYQYTMAQATLARHQMLIERHLQSRELQGNRATRSDTSGRASAAIELARLVRRVAHTMAERSRRNEYGGVFRGLQQQFGINSYRNLPRGRLHEAVEWLERWHGDLLGEPEPPPDI